MDNLNIICLARSGMDTMNLSKIEYADPNDSTETCIVAYCNGKCDGVGNDQYVSIHMNGVNARSLASWLKEAVGDDEDTIAELKAEIASLKEQLMTPEVIITVPSVTDKEAW